MQNKIDTWLSRNCFLFDLDGTLVDSSNCHESAFQAAISQEAPALAERFVYEIHKGKNTEDTFRDLGVVDDDLLLARLCQRKQAFYRKLIAEGAVQLVPYACELLKYLADNQCRLFLVSSASGISARAITNKLQIADFFEVIITADDVDRAKPAPDCYLKCIETAALRSDQSVVIEDALSGIESARGAGLEVVIVNNLELQHRDGYVGTLQQLLVKLTAIRGTECASVP